MIGIFTIATGKYIKFIEPLYKGIRDNFLTNYKKLYVLFTDCDDQIISDISKNLNIEILLIKIKRKGFPGDTLYRYHYFSSIKEKLNKFNLDFVYYFDADMLVIDNVGEEVLPTATKKLVVTAHPGFYATNNQLGTPETNNKSTAFIDNNKFRHCYYAGGFNGGKYEDFMNMCFHIKKNIDIDDLNNIIAIWHDESHLNCFLSNYQNDIKILLPSYCYPESWNLPYKKKILALDKNHKEIRE